MKYQSSHLLFLLLHELSYLILSDVVSGMECGLMRSSKSSFRIVGGGNARVGDFPWQVFILRNGRQHCGGTIIGKDWVLTAAHCLTSSSFIIIAGSHYYNNADRVGRRHRIRNAYKHRQYNRYNYVADIGLIRVTPPFTYRQGKNGRGAIGPVCLPSAGQEFSVAVATVCGVGVTREGGSPSRYMKAAKVKILDPKSCQRVYRSRPYFDSKSQLCAGYPNGGTDACQGDSGGPLTIEVNKRITQVGIVSYGRGCARRGYPGAYTKVASFRNWINHNTGV